MQFQSETKTLYGKYLLPDGGTDRLTDLQANGRTYDQIQYTRINFGWGGVV